VAAAGYISIGCERHTYEHWREHYQKIGESHGYTDKQIAMYGAWIMMVTDTDEVNSNG
jgi:hypothetical protein